MSQEYEIVTETSVRYNGRKYTQKCNGYYYNCSTRKHLHQAIWIEHNGPIPEGYEIHHIDFNKENNDISNLACITKEEHHKIHRDALTDKDRQWRRDNLAINARPKASEWHKSAEGRAWHKRHAEQMIADGTSAFTKKVSLTCDYCGKEFLGKPSKGKHFCCNNHKSAYRRNSGIDNLHFICPSCGKEFELNKYDYNRRRKKFGEDYVPCCSNSCATSKYWVRKGQ